MSKNKTALYLAQAAVIAALYTVLTYAQELFLPGTTSMAVQFRFSEALTMLALFTPAAIPGLTVGCALANLVSLGALPIDMFFGSLATLLCAICMYRLRHIRIKGLPILAALMPALFNGVIIGLEIEIFFIAGTFHITSFLLQAGLVALGELGVCIVLGLPLTALLERTRLADRLFKMQSNG
ncbi:MAG TPA: QueT transporter family protein [Candidatus Scatovicinus merdipullorum]|nr:QueT transporter family protein [Candidatus Scatovicinus merdipullorum]